MGKELTDYYLAQDQNILKARGYDVSYELTWLDGELATVDQITTKTKSAKKSSIPVASWESTTVECYINVGS